MASGRKNYFRHSIFARKDPKLVRLIDDHGKEAYFHFFALLELCAEVACDDFPVGGKFVFRRSTLCHELRVTNSRLGHHLLAMQSALLCESVLSEKEVEILMPNLAKYMGRYDTKKEPNSPNKRKEKEIKEKERKENESKASAAPSDSIPLTPDAVVQLFNAKLSHRLGFARPLGAGKALHDFLQAAQFLKTREDWEELFNKTAQSPFLLGENSTRFKANLPWLVNYDNAQKVLHDSWLEVGEPGAGKVGAITPGNPTGNPYLDENGNLRGDA